MTDWEKKRKEGLPKNRGLGVATGSFVSGAGYPMYRNDLPQSSCMIRVNEDGTAATLYTMSVDIGQGSDTVYCQMAAEAMGYRYENMKIVSGDTETTPHDFGAYSSRQTLMGGWACKRAGEDIKAKILETAGFMMSLPRRISSARTARYSPDPAPRSSPSPSRRSPGSISSSRDPWSHGVYSVPRLAATLRRRRRDFARVQLLHTGRRGAGGRGDRAGRHSPRLDVHDAGQVINPNLMMGQVHGAFTMGLSETLSEECCQRRRQLLNPDLANYRVLTSKTCASSPTPSSTPPTTRPPLGCQGGRRGSQQPDHGRRAKRNHGRDRREHIHAADNSRKGVARAEKKRKPETKEGVMTAMNCTGPFGEAFGTSSTDTASAIKRCGSALCPDGKPSRARRRGQAGRQLRGRDGDAGRAVPGDSRDRCRRCWRSTSKTTLKSERLHCGSERRHEPWELCDDCVSCAEADRSAARSTSSAATKKTTAG
jgi:hypothetical protein